MKLTVRSGSERREIEYAGRRNLLALLREHGYQISARCGGNGTCGKCRVRLIGGTLIGKEEDGFYLSCRTEAEGDAEIEVFEAQGGGLTEVGPRKAARGASPESGRASGRGKIEPGSGRFGVALDIGTTTLALCLVDLESGAELGKRSALNPQGAYGADVISRIKAAGEGQLEGMRACVVDAVNAAIRSFREEFGIRRIETLAAAGNTTMLHLFAGADPSGMGRVPFEPVFLEERTLPGSALGADAEEVVLLPSAHSFVGSDVVCGGLCTGLEGARRAALLDIGTNGEILLSADGKLTCTSTAAGPALEGASIACGTGGVLGAVDRVWSENGRVRFSTIGGAKPIGICGAGLVDAVALMLKEGVIDETGAFREDLERFDICEGVFITPKDIREFQLAKSAISAGLAALTARAGLGAGDLDTLWIAGGLGFYLDPTSADRVGLVPADAAKEIRVIGNSALGGAVRCLAEPGARETCRRIAREAEYLDLSTDEVFLREYMERMYF